MNADMAAWAGVLLVFVGMMAGVVAWLFKTSIKPLNMVVENNTAALNSAMEVMSKHSDKIEDHEIRINDIEKTHEILDCVHKRRIGDSK